MIRQTWAEFKAVKVSKGLPIQEYASTKFYDLTMYDGPHGYNCRIDRDNGADLTDYQDNFQAASNQRINDPYNGKFFSHHLKNGAAYAMNVNGSVAPVDFILTPPVNKIYRVYRMILVMQDSAMNHSKFGGIAGGIANGLLLKITEDGVERNLSEHPIKTNNEFHHLAYDVQVHSAVSDILSVRWTFAKAGTILRLKNSKSDQVKATVQDNLTGLDDFEILLQGHEVNE